jgi:hypothetical protein
MNNWIQSFNRDEAQFQVKRGFGILVSAAKVADYVAAGHGIFHELFRDHEWLFISAATPQADDQVQIEYLQLKSDKRESSVGNSRTTVTEEIVTRHTVTFGAGDQVLISATPMVRPKGRRVTVTTTRTEEVLED